MAAHLITNYQLPKSSDKISGFIIIVIHTHISVCVTVNLYNQVICILPKIFR